MQKFIISSILLILTSCGFIRHGLVPSTFSINGKRYNHLIENRKIPNYGYGNSEGCIVMSELSLDIKTWNNNFSSGQVFDAKDKEPIDSAIVKFLTSDKSDSTTVITDQNGNFNTNINHDVQYIKVEAYWLFYRQLKVDVSDL